MAIAPKLNFDPPPDDIRTAYIERLVPEEIKFGIDKIINERVDQVYKHKKNAAVDDNLSELALESAAIYCLTLNVSYWPHHWPESLQAKLRMKSNQERIAIAGALCAAALDRMYRKNK
jgi:hypothetical protein